VKKVNPSQALKRPDKAAGRSGTLAIATCLMHFVAVHEVMDEALLTAKALLQASQ